jgi:hypothetical protein
MQQNDVMTVMAASNQRIMLHNSLFWNIKMSYRLLVGSNVTVNHSDMKIKKTPKTRQFKKFLLPIGIINCYVPDDCYVASWVR